MTGHKSETRFLVENERERFAASTNPSELSGKLSASSALKPATILPAPSPSAIAAAMATKRPLRLGTQTAAARSSPPRQSSSGRILGTSAPVLTSAVAVAPPSQGSSITLWGMPSSEASEEAASISRFAAR